MTNEEMDRIKLLGQMIERTDDAGLLTAWLAYLEKLSPTKPDLRLVPTQGATP